MNALSKNKSSGDNSALIKLIAAFEVKNYSSLTADDIFELVKRRFISPETTIRVMKERSNVS